MESQATNSNQAKSFVFVMETYFMPDMYVMTARKAVLRLSPSGILELIAISVDGSRFEQIFSAPINQLTKVNTVLSMTYIHFGPKLFRLYDKPITSMAAAQAELSDNVMLPVLNEAPVEEVITSSKNLAKKFKQLKVSGLYTGMGLISLYTVVGIVAIGVAVFAFQA